MTSSEREESVQHDLTQAELSPKIKNTFLERCRRQESVRRVRKMSLHRHRVMASLWCGPGVARSAPHLSVKGIRGGLFSSIVFIHFIVFWFSRWVEVHRGFREFSRPNNLFGFAFGASSISTPIPSPQLLRLDSKMLESWCFSSLE